MDWDDLRNISSGTSILTAALRIGEAIRGRKPALRVRVKPTGDGEGKVTFSAYVSEVGNQVPAFDVHVWAEIEGTDWRVESPPFNLRAGELDKRVPIEVPAPKFGRLVHECNNHQTLYGRDLVVTAVSEEGAGAFDRWHEDEYDPETNAGRYEIMQRAWEEGRNA